MDSPEPPISVPKRTLWQRSFDRLMHPKDLEEQVTQYEVLPFHKRARGSVVIFFCFIMAWSLFVSPFMREYFPLVDVLLSGLLYGIFLFFAYEGYRWALLVILAFWTYDKGYTFYISMAEGWSGAFMSILFWIIGAVVVARAYYVETERRRRARSEPAVSIS